MSVRAELCCDVGFKRVEQSASYRGAALEKVSLRGLGPSRVAGLGPVPAPVGTDDLEPAAGVGVLLPRPWLAAWRALSAVAGVAASLVARNLVRWEEAPW